MAFFMIFTTSLLPMTQKVHIVYLYVKPLCLFVCLWQIKAIHYNDTGIADRTIHLFKGPTWSAELLLNLTTGSDGVAQFSLNTTTFTGDFELIVSWVCVHISITHTHPHFSYHLCCVGVIVCGRSSASYAFSIPSLIALFLSRPASIQTSNHTGRFVPHTMTPHQSLCPDWYLHLHTQLHPALWP